MLSSRVRYALAALTLLARNANQSRTAERITAVTGAPLATLSKVLQMPRGPASSVRFAGHAAAFDWRGTPRTSPCSTSFVPSILFRIDACFVPRPSGHASTVAWNCCGKSPCSSSVARPSPNLPDNLRRIRNPRSHPSKNCSPGQSTKATLLRLARWRANTKKRRQPPIAVARRMTPAQIDCGSHRGS